MGRVRVRSTLEIPAHMPEHIPLRIGVWSSKLGKEVRDSINHLFQPNDDLNVLVINIDALITAKGKLVIEKFLNTRLVMMVIDESTTIKSPKAKRTKAAIMMGTRARYRRILTGSPVTKSSATSLIPTCWGTQIIGRLEIGMPLLSQASLVVVE